MDPVTIAALIGGATTLGAGFLRGFGPQPGAPAFSSAMSGGTMSAPFNVGGGIGGAAQIGALAQFAPWIIIGVLAWLLLKK